MYATLTIAASLQGNLVLTSCRKDPTHRDTVHVKDIRGRTLGKKGEGKYPAPRLRKQSNPGHPGWSMLLTWKMHYFFLGTEAHQGTSCPAVQWPEAGMMGHLTSSQGSDLSWCGESPSCSKPMDLLGKILKIKSKTKISR